MKRMDQAFDAAARIIAAADALLITAGAGMGVDSGLPDFRGSAGFWRAYPIYEQLGLRFEDAANPQHFARDPAFAWGFYGHRLNLYRKTVPHAGFKLLLDWAQTRAADYFVVTSNVDGQFQVAGFDERRIWEVHGSIHHLQCIQPCNGNITDNTASPVINERDMRATGLPHCAVCGDMARPNILMFGDGNWLSERTDRQRHRLETWLAGLRGRSLAVIELGAGTALPTIRHLGESIARQYQGHCIRINPREAEIMRPHVAISEAALPALREIQRRLAG